MAPEDSPEPIRLTPRAFPLSEELASRGVAQALRALAAKPGLVALDSAAGRPRRWSIVAFDPIIDFGAERGRAPRSLDDLGAVLRKVQLSDEAEADAALARAPFAGGFLGALAYELGVRGHDLGLPAPHWPGPPIAGGIYGDWLLFEHGPDGPSATLFLSEGEPSRGGDATVEERRQQVVDALGAEPAAVRGAPLEPAPRRARRAVPAAEHRARVERVRALIAEGEIYQANVSHRITAEVDADDLSLYLALRQVNPAPYMGFCRFAMPGAASAAILSASPELLLELGPGGGAERIARTRPIKGTIARGASPGEDAAQRAALLDSAKDRAELAMIVDLERNDLGRIAEPGGVETHGFPALETYASVHHLVADVTARVRADVGAIDVIASVFPGGSITGAPKLRSMEVIAEVEAEGRGFFTGALGLIDVRGAVALNILIRTMIHREDPGGDRKVSFHVGGGITWGSDPAAEDGETLIKADGLLGAIGVDRARGALD